MPRIYKPDPRGKKYKRYPKELIEQAVREYNDGSGSLSGIAQKFEIDKSVLYRHSIKNMKTQGGQTVLSEDTELAFIKYINLCAEWGYPLEVYDLRLLVKNYLDKLGVTEKRFKDNMPGPEFAKGFLKRHQDKISQRVSQNIKRNRAAVSSDIINKYFEQLKQSISDIPIGNIVNYDETNLADDPGRKKIITKRGTKYPERVMNHSKSAVSIMMACTAAGETLPPYVVYKAQNLYDTWTKNGPKGARYNRTHSGWFDAKIFEDWVTTMILPFFENKPGKKCLIGDNLSSHLSIDLIRTCQEKDIHFIFLPANSTHITQPLDVAFFRPMKIAWRNIILKWKKTDGRYQSSIPKGCFPKLLSKLMETLKENSQANIIAGFRKTGIHPLDPSQILKRLPDWENEVKEIEAIDETIIDLLKEMRYGTVNIVEPKRKKKLNVQAGKSVLCSSDEDYIDTDPEYVPASCSATIEKKNAQKENESNDKVKGKGRGKKTKSYIQHNNYKENEAPRHEHRTDEVASCSYNINRMPFIFEDDLDGIGQMEIFSSVPMEEKNQQKDNIASTIEVKGKGRGKKTKSGVQDNIYKENEAPRHENQTKEVASCSYNIHSSPYDINNMPFVFEEDLDGIGHVETVLRNEDLSRAKKENKQKKVEIISNVLVKDEDLKKLFLNNKAPTTSNETHIITKSRRPSYYRNDADILRDLIESD